MELTRRQRQIYEFLRDQGERFDHPPTLDELCAALGVKSRGSLHKHIQALIQAGLIEPMKGKQRGLRLIHAVSADALPLLGYIAAGRPIEAVRNEEHIEVPSLLRTRGRCYVLKVKGDSMVDEGILDGDYVIVEARSHARNGEIVVALIDGGEVTLKRIEQRPDAVVLHPANAALKPMRFAPDAVQIQGILVGQMRRY